ncbi:hypothetical protein ABNIH14_19421, partial [Acinetobacter baumannii ABNIH14]
GSLADITYLIPTEDFNKSLEIKVKEEN